MNKILQEEWYNRKLICNYEVKKFVKNSKKNELDCLESYLC